MIETHHNSWLSYGLRLARKRIGWSSAVACILLLTPQIGWAQIKAFPQAEGFGAAAAGGRGGDVYHVTNLNNSGVGSLRHGIENAPPTGRTIVFDVGGWINLTTKLGVDTHIRNLTIAGQTAPGGIGVRGSQFSVGGDDVIVRHMRFRPGKAAGSNNDSVNTNNNAERVIYDHISAEFSTDGGFDNQATDVTLQFSSVSYGLQTHSTGALLENPHRLSFHHNLFAHNNTRNPKHRVQETLDWVNNVVYNWDTRAIEMQGTDDPAFQWTANIDGNYFIAGPDHGNTKPLSGGSIQNYETWWGVNAYDSDEDSTHNGKDYAFTARDFSTVSSALTRWRSTPFPVADEIWKDDSTQAAYERVLSEFGATPWARDDVNQVLHDSVVNRSGNIITRESDLVPLGVSNAGFGTLGGVAAPVDSDGDGIPDWWEKIHTPDLVNVASNNQDFDNDGYTDLEEYLNDIAAFKATGPLEFIDAGSGRYAQWQNWTRRWEPSRVDEVHIDAGTATVDSVGQKAGILRIGSAAETLGMLNIADGWLAVSEAVVIGADPDAMAQLNLSNGTLRTPLLEKGQSGTFNFTGGVLHADVIAFDLTNNGGTLAPGDSIGPTHVDVPAPRIGETHVMGDLELVGGSLHIELSSPNAFDRLTVDGAATLGGDLVIELLDGYAPEDGSWQILTAANIVGDFNSVSDGFHVTKQAGSLTLHVGAPTALLGDFNNDGIVDASDYTYWRDRMGTEYDAEHFQEWRDNFGATLSPEAAGLVSGALVPEPANCALLLISLAIHSARRRR